MIFRYLLFSFFFFLLASLLKTISFFQDQELPTVVSQEDNFLLLQSVQDQKIKAAIFQINKFKTSGLDGFWAAFFQDH